MKAMTRRHFVNASAAGATALSAGAGWLVSTGRARAQKAPAEKVVLALIGAGGRGSGHATGMAKLPGVEFKYVCDIWEARGGSLVRELGKIQGRTPERISDMRHALDDKDVDAVVIATPDHWHAVATVWACQAGKDVYVEKNPSMTVWEGRKMVEAARKYGRIVQAGFQNRSGPYAASAREYIDIGRAHV